MKAAHGATKWAKNNLLMIPPWIWFSKKVCLIAPFLSYPDVVIACIEHKAAYGSIQSN